MKAYPHYIILAALDARSDATRWHTPLWSAMPQHVYSPIYHPASELPDYQWEPYPETVLAPEPVQVSETSRFDEIEHVIDVLLDRVWSNAMTKRSWVRIQDRLTGAQLALIATSPDPAGWELVYALRWLDEIAYIREGMADGDFGR